MQTKKSNGSAINMGINQPVAVDVIVTPNDGTVAPTGALTLEWAGTQATVNIDLIPCAGNTAVGAGISSSTNILSNRSWRVCAIRPAIASSGDSQPALVP